MTICIISFALLFIYFELLGQSILSLFKIKIRCTNVYIGFFAFIALIYTFLSLLNIFHVPFLVIILLYLIAMAFGLALIIKERNMIKLNLINVGIIFAIVLFLAFYSYNTKLGDLNGFDSLTYINLVSGVSLKSNMFTIDINFGGYTDMSISRQYVYQVFYTFASFIVFIEDKIANLCHIEVFKSTLYIWIFQLFFSGLLASLSISIFETFDKNRVFVNCLLLSLLVLVFGRLYYNNVFGFFGNSYRVLPLSFAFIEINNYFKQKNKASLILFYIFWLSYCGFSSSGAYSLILLLFGMAFILVEHDKKMIAHYAIVLLVPLINVLNVFIHNTFVCIVASFSMCLMLYLFNDLLYKIFLPKKNRYIILSVFAVLMILISVLKTGKLLHFDAFINNQSETADMLLDFSRINWKYFGIEDIYKIVSVVSLIFYLLLSKEAIKKYILVMIIAIFNPLCIGYLSDINVVFYRAFEIILNPGTLCIFVHFLFEKIKNKYFVAIVSLLIILSIFKVEDFSLPRYYHNSFVMSEDYDKVNKMSKSETEVISFLKYDIYSSGIDSPYILTTNKLTFSEIPNGRYIFARTNPINKNWNSDEYKLYVLFNPNESIEVDQSKYYEEYKNIRDIVINSGIDYIVLANDYLFYNCESNEYYELHYLLDDYFLDNICFTNNDYIVYKIN